MWSAACLPAACLLLPVQKVNVDATVCAMGTPELWAKLIDGRGGFVDWLEPSLLTAVNDALTGLTGFAAELKALSSQQQCELRGVLRVATAHALLRAGGAAGENLTDRQKKVFSSEVTSKNLVLVLPKVCTVYRTPGSQRTSDLCSVVVSCRVVSCRLPV
jgi:hypothetical protein